ncbi:MAG TPA: FAD binding domain-containing protein [Candidatus Binatia bacterium]|nr:FAD binding domain-containing protein [Candidatus Binatia bacterium]
MSLPGFKLLRPRTVDEAVEHLEKHGGNVRVLAGGTDLIPSMRQKLFEPEYVLDVRGIADLRGIRMGNAKAPLLAKAAKNGAPAVEPGSEVIIGALTSLREIERSNYLQEHFPVLTEAAATVASPVIRNMGTIGGNICLDTRCLWYNQSLAWRKGCGFCIKKDGDLCHVAPGGSKCWAVFSGDTPPALLCLNAEIEIVGPAGARRVALGEFYALDGINYRKLAANELVTRIFLPAESAGYRGVYRKLRVRGSIDYPLAGVAVAMKRSSNGHGVGDVADARVAITAVNPAPLLVAEAGEILSGRKFDEELAEIVGDMAARTAKPLTTSALTPEYRREMIRVFTKRAVLAAAN